MKKDCKRLLGLALVLCLLISIVPAVVAADETQPAVTSIYAPDFSTAVNGALPEGWGQYTNAGLWGEKEDEGESITLLDQVIEGQADGAGLALVYSENSMLASFKKDSSRRPYFGLYYQMDKAYDAVSITYTHIARDASKLGRILMPGSFDTEATSGDRFTSFPLEASIYNDKITVTWNGETLVSALDIDWRNNGEKVQVIGYSNEADGGYDVGFALYIGDEFICGGTTLMESFAGFNAIRFGFNNGQNSELTMKDITVDAMDISSLGVYNLDNPVENLGYVPDVQYADPLHTVVSDATTGYAFVSWKVDETLLYAPDFVGETDGVLPAGWGLTIDGTTNWTSDTYSAYSLPLYASNEACTAAGGTGLVVSYADSGMLMSYKKNTISKYSTGAYYQLNGTYNAVSVSYDHFASSGSKLANILIPTYYDAQTGEFTSIPLTVYLHGYTKITWDGQELVNETIDYSKGKNMQIVAFSNPVDGGCEIGFALYIDGVYKCGGTKLVESFPGFNAACLSYRGGQNCELTMKNIRIRSMDVDSFGVYNLDDPAENYGYVTDKLYTDPLHTVESTATTGYVFTTWKEDSSFLKRFDFSNDTAGALPAGWAMSINKADGTVDQAFDNSDNTLPLYASDADWQAAKEASGATNEPGLVLSYEGNSMYMAYKKKSMKYQVGLYYKLDDTYETMTVNYDHTSSSGAKLGNFLMPTYYDAETGLFTSIPLTISMAGTTTVTWDGEKLVDAESISYASGKNVKIYTYCAEVEGGKKIGFELYLDGELKCSGSKVVESFPGFNAVRVRSTSDDNCTLTMDNILVYTDVARIGETFYSSVETAAKAAQTNDTMVLLVDSNDTIQIGVDMAIDMNGHNLGGAVIADGAVLAGFDSANNDYSGYGTIGSVSGNVADTAVIDGRNYIAITGENGGISFHRYYLKTTATVLRVEQAAPSLYYKYALAGDEAVLGAIDSCGVAYWIGETEETVMAQTSLPEGAYSAGTATAAAAGELYTGEGSLITDLLVAGDDANSENVNKLVSGRAYIKVGDTLVYSDNCLADTMGGSIETADSLWETLLVKQRNALSKLYEAFADIISLLNVNNYNADTAAVLASFQEDLAQEEGYAQTYTAGWENSENAATNGDFSDGITGWEIYSTSVAETVAEDGNTVLSLSRVSYEDGTNSQNSPFVSQSADLVPGSRCEISFRYKIVECAEGGSVGPSVYIRWTDENNTETVEGVWPDSKVANGEWGTVSGYVYLPENARNISIRVRARTTCDSKTYMDDIVVRSEHITLDTQNVFFYTDSRDSSAELTATVYGGDCSTVTFQVYRAEEQVWTSDAIAVADGKASASFALSNLTQLGEPYAVVATGKNSSGDVTYVQTQNIYMYNRPTHYTADGTFLRDGEVFYPVFGYGVTNTDIQSEEIAMENAISVARIGTFEAADAAVAALDKLAAKGMMGMICMHPGMHASGSASNMEKTLAVMGDPRVHNHPALFGYCVQDEAFVNYTNGDPLFDLENSYRLIRKLDNKHIIMATENYTEHYDETSKYLDAMIADIYCNAAEQKVYNKISLANQTTEKPVYALTRSCVLTDYSELPTVNDMRNNNYQALLGGATGLGYYKLNKANGSYDVWDAANEDGTGGDPELWAAMQQFYMNENALLMKHFYCVNYETIQQNLVKEDSYWHYSFEADGNTYVILLGMMEDAASSVTAQVSGGWTDCTVSVIAGTDSVPVLTDGVLSVTVNGVEAILCQITPNA